MDPLRPIADPTELLAHLGWVQRLARALVRDAAAADDLAQETLRVTLEQPAGRVGSGARLRGWLRSVLARLAIDRRRAERSRAEREESVARPELTPTTFEVVERSARQQQVVAAVMQLDEPFRSTLLYRFLDELSTRDVAARMGVSEELVRKRLQRALERLRARLDSEFGADTRSWALALGPFTGVAIVGAKTKLAVAAVVVLGAVLAWRVVVESPPREAPARGLAPPSNVAATAEAPASRAQEADSSAAPSRSKSHVEAGSSDPTWATLLPLRVVDARDASCTRGRIFGFWRDGAEEAGSSWRSFEHEIDGELTRIVLPPRTVQVLVAASVPGLAASTRVGVTDPRTETEPADRRGHLWREVTVRVGAPIAAPTLTGRIRIDGAPYVPRGLVVEPQGTADSDRPNEKREVRIHAIDARYDFGPRPPERFRLWVTSDETVPRCVDVGESVSTLDLDLETARKLVLTVLDRKTGEPLPDVELHLRMLLPIAGTSMFHEEWRDHSHFLVTDEQGVASVRGLPREGQIEIRRDDSRKLAPRRYDDGFPIRVERMREPLLELTLDDKLPDPIERTIRIDAQDRRCVIRGRLGTALRAPRPGGEPPIDVRWARVGEGERADVHDEIVPLDEQGGFAIEVDLHHDYRVWADRETLRVSELAAMRIDDDEPAPIELQPRRGTEVLLRLLRCPTDGFVRVFVPDPGDVIPRGLAIKTSGGTLERRVVLDGPAELSIGWTYSRGTETGNRQSIDVDPATTNVVEVDLQADVTRAVVLELVGAELPSQSQLWMKRLDAPPGAPSSMVSVALHGAKGDGPVALAEGRYLAFLAGLHGIAAGEVVVASGARDAPVTIRLEVEKHSKSALGAGVEIQRLGSIDLDEMLREACTLRFDQDPLLENVDAILLPVGAKFTVLEK